MPSPQLDVRRRKQDNQISGTDNVLFYASGMRGGPEADHRGLGSEYGTINHIQQQAVGVVGDEAEDFVEGRVLCNYEPEQYLEKVESHADRLTRALLPLVSLQEYIDKNLPQEESSSSNSIEDPDVVGVSHSSLPPSPPTHDSAPPTGMEERPSLNQPPSDAPFDEVENAVTQSIQGLYKLWISSNQRPSAESVALDDRTSRTAFLLLVQRALHSDH